MSGILVHEWLSPTGGSENVFEQLVRIFPGAERWCLWNASEGRFADVNETWLARTPLRGRKAAAVPLMPLVWRTMPRREAEWILTSSHAFAHQVRFGGAASDAPKLVYAHTPARYVWAPEADSRGQGVVARTASALLRPVDRRRAGEAHAIAANSKYVADRIARTWEREATVIYPPVDTARFGPEPALTEEESQLLDELPDSFVLGASRFVPYKRLEDAIRAGSVVDVPVVIAGGGPDEERLRAVAAEARVPVTFMIDPSHELLSALYRRATVLVFSPVEDFGIMPVEAMAAGTPVIVNVRGGAAESVVDGRTGAHVEGWQDAELAAAVTRAAASSAAACRARADEFSTRIFHREVDAWVRSAVKG
ncbi:glycosyltransferase [Microbacterium sp. PA5]|uniref:glycosyltransferase n=1 Tax=Microbacterium sp. PA5 TaxID=3416654 RepID=UPI003CF7673D